MKGHGEKFTRQMDVAIVGLLTQPTIDEAAKHAGVSGPTLWRWMQEPTFQTEYRKARRQAMGQATAQLQQAGCIAVKALKEIIQGSGGSASARVAAARTVLEIGLRAIELEDLDERVAELERLAEKAGRFRSSGANHEADESSTEAGEKRGP